MTKILDSVSITDVTIGDSYGAMAAQQQDGAELLDLLWRQGSMLEYAAMASVLAAQRAMWGARRAAPRRRLTFGVAS